MKTISRLAYLLDISFGCVLMKNKMKVTFNTFSTSSGFFSWKPNCAYIDYVHTTRYYVNHSPLVSSKWRYHKYIYMLLNILTYFWILDKCVIDFDGLHVPDHSVRRLCVDEEQVTFNWSLNVTKNCRMCCDFLLQNKALNAAVRMIKENSLRFDAFTWLQGYKTRY